AGVSGFTYVRKDGTTAAYQAHGLFDLRISNQSIGRFADAIGFSLPAMAAKLANLLGNHTAYAKKLNAHLFNRNDDGVEDTYNLSEPRNYFYVVNGIVV